MADFVIGSTEGGFSTKSPTSLFENQCVQASNVEHVFSKCGERRLGTDGIDFTGSDLANCDRIVWQFRHFPTTDPADSQYWALGITDGTPDTAVLAYKDTSWHTVSVTDAFTLDGSSELQVRGASLHGKLFILYNSAVDRVHLWDGTSLRRAGLAQPSAPTAADSGAAGTVNDNRYYRVRYTRQVSSVTVTRSEPSAALLHNPGASNVSVTVTKPASISEGETHWELEASKDNVLFYRIATTAVGTTTYVDSITDGTSYRESGVLSEDIGDYTLIPSAKYITVDFDRPIFGGSWETAAYASRVQWTPVGKASGVGNDERLELDTDPWLDLDNYEGGGLTDLSESINGYVYATKLSAIYQLVRSGEREDAYDVIPITKAYGVFSGSLVTGIDNQGTPSLFGLDFNVGPIYIGSAGNGVETCGTDLKVFWDTYMKPSLLTAVNVASTYFPDKKQSHWAIDTFRHIVLHVQNMRQTPEGYRGGWAHWPHTTSTGGNKPVYSMILFSDNIDAGIARSKTLVPFYGLDDTEDLCWRGETGHKDNGREYVAVILTRHMAFGNLIHDFYIDQGVLMGKISSGAQLYVALIGHRAHQTDNMTTNNGAAAISFTAASIYEDTGWCLRKLEFKLNGIATVHLAYGDDGVTPVTAQWQIEQIAFQYFPGQRKGGPPNGSR